MNENYENFKFDKNRNIPFSLQNSRVKEIKFHNKALILKVDSIFGYANNEEKIYQGELCFKECGIDLCSVLVFNKTLGKGHFTGKSFYLQEFIEQYREAEFEIITEGYFKNATTYTGWL